MLVLTRTEAEWLDEWLETLGEAAYREADGETVELRPIADFLKSPRPTLRQPELLDTIHSASNVVREDLNYHPEDELGVRYTLEYVGADDLRLWVAVVSFLVAWLQQYEAQAQVHGQHGDFLIADGLLRKLMAELVEGS